VAFDATNAGASSGGSCSVDLTVGSFSNMLLLVQVAVSPGTALITDIQVTNSNGTSSIFANQAATDAWGTTMTVGTWYLVAPPSGTNTVVVTVNDPSVVVNVAVSSYYHVLQSGPIGASGSQASNGDVTSEDFSLQTAQNGSMVVSLFYSPDGGVAPTVAAPGGCYPDNTRWSSSLGLYAQGDDQLTCIGGAFYDFQYQSNQGSQMMGAEQVEILSQ
jgi:hypothetical protein